MFKGKAGVALDVTSWTFCFRVCEIDEMYNKICAGKTTKQNDEHLGSVANVVLPSTFEE